MPAEHLDSEEIQELFRRYVISNCGRFPAVLSRGEGAYVWDAEGSRYLDLFCGGGCNLLGHCPTAVVDAVREQLGRLIHAPNTWHTTLQGQWAKAIADRSFGGQSFFCNSGAEAVEAAVKLARWRGAPKRRYKIVAFEGGFHGCTLGAAAATANPKYHEGFGPLAAGFVYAPFGDLEAVRQRIDDETAALLIEPIQGEAGVRIPPDGFLPGLRQLADERGALLIFDETQTGCGRTGDWFAYQSLGATPDVLVLAGAICGGLPGGAMSAAAEVAESFRPGMHVSTFGGNPIAAAAGLALLETIDCEQLLERAKQLGGIFRDRFEQFRAECDLVRDVRVRGAMIGIELSAEAAPVVKTCRERKLLVNCAGETVVRLLPPLVLTDAEAHDGCDLLIDALKQLADGHALRPREF